MAESATVDEVASCFKALRRTVAASNFVSWFSGEKSNNLFVDNLSRGDIFRNFNLGSAVLRQGETSTSRTNPPGTMVSFLSTDLGNFSKGFYTSLQVIHVIGRDWSNNFRFLGNLDPQAWALMDARLNDIQPPTNNLA